MSDRAGVVVYGATGLTGGLLVDALLARGVRPMIAGRNEAKLRALAKRVGLDDAMVRVTDVDNAADVAQLVDDVGVLVSCAGPFGLVGEPLVAACATRGVHYADSTGEVDFVNMIARRYDATAQANACALVPSAAFEVAVSDAAAARAAEGLGDDLSVEIAYATRESATSRGTQASVLHALSRPAWVRDNGELHEEPVARVVRRVTFPPPVGEQSVASFGSPEVITVARHVSARTVRAFMASRWARALRLSAPAVTALARMSGPLASGWLERVRSNPTSETIAKTQFHVLVEARRADGRGRRVIASGSDPYRLSAALLAETARVLASGAGGVGLRAPSQVLGVDRVFALVRGMPGGAVAFEELTPG